MRFLLPAAKVIFLVWIGGFLSGCDQTWEWHQKLTVEVQTPDGVRTGSSVVKALWRMGPKWLKIGDSGGGPGVGEVNGEAVVLELSPGQYLFVLLKGYSANTAIAVFSAPKKNFHNREGYKAALDHIVSVAETRKLTRDQYPLLVTFEDINDPASVKRVDPGNLAATFGPGYRLNSITMSITDEPVTEGKMEKVLGWWCDYRKRRARLNDSTSIAISTNELSDTLGTGAFRIGDCT